MKFRGIFKSIFVVLLILINCLFLMQPNVSASVNSAENNNVAINDNYSNDSILIMLNNESSLKF